MKIGKSLNSYLVYFIFQIKVGKNKKYNKCLKWLLHHMTDAYKCCKNCVSIGQETLKMFWIKI